MSSAICFITLPHFFFALGMSSAICFITFAAFFALGMSSAICFITFAAFFFALGMSRTCHFRFGFATMSRCRAPAALPHPTACFFSAALLFEAALNLVAFSFPSLT